MKKDDLPQTELVFEKVVFVHIPKVGDAFIMEMNPRYTLHSSISHLNPWFQKEPRQSQRFEIPWRDLIQISGLRTEPTIPIISCAGRPKGRVSFIVAANHF